MSTKSNILTSRRKSDVYPLEITLPPEEWPTLLDTPEAFFVPAFLDESEPIEDQTIISSGASWTAPTSTVTFVLMAADVQDNETPAPDDSQFQIINEVDGIDGSFVSEDLGLVYKDLFGPFVLSDLGKYVPYIMKFVDQYNRESVVKSGSSVIIAI